MNQEREAVAPMEIEAGRKLADWLRERGDTNYAALVDRLTSVAELALRSGGEGWQDISTAPKDGTWFLAIAVKPGWGATRIVRYADPYDRLPIHGEGGIWPSPPTHWMPLPPSPSTQGEG